MHQTFLSGLLILTLSTQGVAAKNTNDDWKWASEYYATYGEWTVGCDRRSDDVTIKRCYLRYVDAYAREPFGALFVFVTIAKENGLSFNFEYERGVRFNAPWSVGAGEQTMYVFDPDRCPPGTECRIDGDTAIAFAEAISGADQLIRFSLTDRGGRSFELAWPTAGFSDALDDLRKQSAERNL